MEVRGGWYIAVSLRTIVPITSCHCSAGITLETLLSKPLSRKIKLKEIWTLSNKEQTRLLFSDS